MGSPVPAAGRRGDGGPLLQAALQPGPHGAADRATGVAVRRYERDRPGELVHVDAGKLGNIPGGGWRVAGKAQGGRNSRAATTARKNSHPVLGYGYLHTALDDHSRLAYSEILPDERKETAVAATPSSLLSFFSTRAAHEAHVIPVMARSTSRLASRTAAGRPPLMTVLTKLTIPSCRRPRESGRRPDRAHAPAR